LAPAYQIFRGTASAAAGAAAHNGRFGGGVTQPEES
jgi:hypothetical protein